MRRAARTQQRGEPPVFFLTCRSTAALLLLAEPQRSRNLPWVPVLTRLAGMVMSRTAYPHTSPSEGSPTYGTALRHLHRSHAPLVHRTDRLAGGRLRPPGRHDAGRPGQPAVGAAGHRDRAGLDH